STSIPDIAIALVAGRGCTDLQPCATGPGRGAEKIQEIRASRSAGPGVPVATYSEFPRRSGSAPVWRPTGSEGEACPPAARREERGEGKRDMTWTERHLEATGPSRRRRVLCAALAIAVVGAAALARDAAAATQRKLVDIQISPAQASVIPGRTQAFTATGVYS